MPWVTLAQPHTRDLGVWPAVGVHSGLAPALPQVEAQGHVLASTEELDQSGLGALGPWATQAITLLHLSSGGAEKRRQSLGWAGAQG